MRIGIEYTAAVRQGGGIGRYARSLVRGLTTVGSAHSYRLLFAGGAPRNVDEKWPHNFRLIPLPLSDYWMTVLWQRLRVPLWADLFTGTVDLFHSPDFVLPPLRKAKSILTVHDLSFLRHPECYEAAFREYLESAVPRSVGRADLILADSESTRQDLIELLAVDSDRVEVLYSGVEKRFHPITDAISLARVREQYGLPERFILSVGTLQPRKNYERLLEAYGCLIDRIDLDVKLVIAGGKGWLYERIFRRVEELELNGKVIFLGFFEDDDLPTLYILADLFVFPSLYEGFGLPPLEAMACGTPVVSSNASSLPEVVDGVAEMVDPLDVDGLAEAMFRVLSEGDLRAEMIRKGLIRAGQFTWEGAARALLHSYERLGMSPEA